MIIYMIKYHICQWGGVNYDCLDKILFFFMPWFFFKSGMFFSYNRNYIQQITKDARHLIMPFVAFSLIAQLFFLLKLFLHGDYYWVHYCSFPKYILLTGSTPANPPLWFLLSLFAVKEIYNLIYFNKYKSLILAALSCFCFICFYYKITQPLYIGNCSLGLLFYWLGDKCRSLQYNKNIFFVAGSLYLVIFFVNHSMVDMRINSVISGNYLLYIIFALCGIVLMNNIAKLIFSYLHANCIIDKLCKIGSNSIVYYVCHWIVIVIADMILSQMGVIKGDTIYIITLTLSCIICLPIIDLLFEKNKKIQILLGKQWK